MNGIRRREIKAIGAAGVLAVIAWCTFGLREWREADTSNRDLSASGSGSSESASERLSTSTESTAATVSLAERRESHGDLQPTSPLDVLRRIGNHLAIHVEAPSGTPVAAAKVRLYPKTLRGPRELNGFDPVAFRADRAVALEITDISGDAHFEHGVVPETIVCVEADGFAPSFGTVTHAEAVAGRSVFPLANAGSIQALIVDGRTSRPIAHAIVFASHGVGDVALDTESQQLTFRALTARRATTDLAGKCELRGLDREMNWCVWIYADGYPPRRTFPVPVVPYEQTIRVFDGTPMHGYVVDTEGKGIPGTTVKGSVRGVYPVQDICFARTHDDGSFELDAVPTAPLYFLVNKIGYAFEAVELEAPTLDEPLTFVLRKQAPLSGIVVDDLGRPVAGARLEFSAVERSASPGVFETYDDGTFDMPWINPDHTFIVDVSAAGHTNRRIAGVRPQSGLRLVLDRRGEVLGRVINTQGEPVSNIRIAWLSPRLPPAFEDYQREQMAWKALVAPDGGFTLTDVDAGAIDLYVAAEGYERPEAIRFEIPPGGRSALKVIRLSAARSIAGRIVSSDGQPIRGATVSWLLDSSLGFPGGRETPTKSDTDNAGQFTLRGLPDRPFQLRVTDNLHANALYSELRVDDFPRDLIYNATSRIEGRILTPWSCADSAISAAVRPEGSNTWSGFDVAPDGRFSFGPIPSGAWIFQLEDFWAGRSAAAQSSELLRRVEVAPGETVTVEFDLRARSRIVGFVSGTFSPDEFRRVAARLLEVDANGRRAHSPVAVASCESDGRFVLHSFPPGRYVVEAVSQLRGVGACAERIVEVRDAQQTVEVALEFGALTLSGRTVDGDDHPIVADVSVVRERDGAILLVVHTDPDGSYRLAPPAAERFRLHVSAPGFANQDTECFGPDDLPSEPLEHVLEPEARLAIAVRDDDGAPIAGVQVEVRDALEGGVVRWQGKSAYDGVALATRLPAGAFRVSARHAAYPSTPPASVDVEWGETRQLAIALTRVGRAALLVTDASGAPRAQAVVTIAPTADPTAARTGVTDAAGRVEFERLPIGRWRATCTDAEPVQFDVAPAAEAAATLVVADSSG